MHVNMFCDERLWGIFVSVCRKCKNWKCRNLKFVSRREMGCRFQWKICINNYVTLSQYSLYPYVCPTHCFDLFLLLSLPLHQALRCLMQLAYSIYFPYFVWPFDLVCLGLFLLFFLPIACK